MRNNVTFKFVNETSAITTMSININVEAHRVSRQRHTGHAHMHIMMGGSHDSHHLWLVVTTVTQVTITLNLSCLYESGPQYDHGVISDRQQLQLPSRSIHVSC
jgi:hypothetical protein